jgi:hypothetical protein
MLQKEMENTKTNSVEFYFLLDDNTWVTDFIDVPTDIISGGTPSENENGAIDYVYNNVKLSDKVVLVGVYSWGDNNETD